MLFKEFKMCLFVSISTVEAVLGASVVTSTIKVYARTNSTIRFRNLLYCFDVENQLCYLISLTLIAQKSDTSMYWITTPYPIYKC